LTNQVCLKQNLQRGWKAKHERRLSKDFFYARYHLILFLKKVPEKVAILKGLNKKQINRLGQLNTFIKDGYAFMRTGTNRILAKVEDT
jgi:hypothetical protein